MATITRPRWPRRGFTIIELAIVLGLVAILAAVALPAIDFNRYRMDASARLVQNVLLGAQQRAVQRNVQVLILFNNYRQQFQIVDDTSGDGGYQSAEHYTTVSLPDGMIFNTPPVTIDNQSASTYALGTGIVMFVGYPMMTFYPNGTSSGDAVIYLGSPQSRLQDYRAIKVSAATARMYFYRMRSDGTWAQSDM